MRCEITEISHEGYENVEGDDDFVACGNMLTLRWNPLENWVISTFSGQKPCTRIISSILHSFLRFSRAINVLSYAITPKKSFLREPQKTNCNSFKFHKTKFYTWRFYVFSQFLWNLKFSFPGCHKKLCLVLKYYRYLITSTALEKCKKECDVA